MDTEFWMNKALEAIGRLKDGETFRLQDLFEGVEWRKLEVGDRLYFGKAFKKKTLNGEFPHVRFDETSKGTAHYIYKK